jgi:hypothetical protein
MKIQPSGPDPTSSRAARQLDKNSAAQPVRQEGRPANGSPEVARDRAEISDAARDLGERAKTSGECSAQLPADRLRSVMDRVCSGYYDRPEVRDAVLSRLSHDLESLPKD